MRKRKYVQDKKVGSSRIDLPLKKKKKYIRMILTLKQPYKVVKRTYREDLGKDLSYSTFSTWKKSGSDLLDPEFRGINCRGSYKQPDIVESFEEEDF